MTDNLLRVLRETTNWTLTEHAERVCWSGTRAERGRLATGPALVVATITSRVADANLRCDFVFDPVLL